MKIPFQLPFRYIHHLKFKKRDFSSSSSSTNVDYNILNNWIKGKDTIVSEFQTLKINQDDHGIFEIKLNRPDKLNAFNMQLWIEYESVFKNIINKDDRIKVVLLSGEGKGFSAGMDLNVFGLLQNILNKETCEAKKREKLISIIKRWQNIVSLPETLCPVPVLAAIHGSCIGGAVDIISACDLRYCDESSLFSIKEIDLGIVADLGTLQRLPNIMGENKVKELAYTGKLFNGIEAEKLYGLVNTCYLDKITLFNNVKDIAKQIGEKSSVAIRGIKKSIQYSRDHNIHDSLEHIRLYNGSMLFSEDLNKIFLSMTSKTKPVFRKER